MTAVLGFRSNSGKVYCASPRCLMPTPERMFRFESLTDPDNRGAVCCLCKRTLGESAEAKDLPFLDPLSVRAGSVLEGYFRSKGGEVDLSVTTVAVLAYIDARELSEVKGANKKTLAEIRKAATDYGFDLMNWGGADQVGRSHQDIWKISETRIIGDSLQVTLQGVGTALKILRPKSEAPVLYAGQRVRIAISPVEEDDAP